MSKTQPQKPLPSGPYQPTLAEEDILRFWLDNKLFKPEYDSGQRKVIPTSELKAAIQKGDKKPFVIIDPPPNAYMLPHTGNVSGYAYQDLLGRFARMQGKTVFLQPGKDHAGIQGEIVVLREYFKKKGLSKHNLTREEFYAQTYEYFLEVMKGAQQSEQRIGLSADFDRDVFTLDPDIVQEVLTTFTTMYNDNLVYKGVRLVNWCPTDQTALADIDTEKKDRQTTFEYITYPLLQENQRVWNLNFYANDAFKAIVAGQKTVETRALNPDEPDRYFGDIKAGDIAVVVNKDNHREAHPFIVKEVRRYSSVAELVDNEDMKAIYSKEAPSDLKQIEKGYYSLSPDYEERITKHGLVAIELRPWTPADNPEHITMATTRPETMVGDTAVVVNPKDKRYTEFLNRQVLLPLVWRAIPIITDEQIDLELGTGALKLTPAHAPEDYEIMLRHNEVGYINVIDKQAKLTGPVGKYFGMSVEEAKQAVLEDLKTLKLWEKSEEKEQQVAVCERCKSVIEPIMSSQWFIKVDPLRKPAIEAVTSGEIAIHPKYMTRKYLHWMENLRDWPISRSLWWGYRMPVWYKGEVTESIDAQGHIVETINGVEVKDFADAVAKDLAKVSIESPSGTTVTVVRHSESGFSKEDRYTGHNDSELTENGQKIAKERAQDLIEQGYDIIITSPLLRSKQTGAIIAEVLKNAGQKVEIVEEPNLIERDLGKLGGLTWAEYTEQYPDYAAKSTPLYHPEIPGGESLEALQKRAQKVIEGLVKHYAGKKVLIVAHKYIMRNLRSALTGISLDGLQNYEAQYVRGFTHVIPDGTWIQDDNVFDTWFSSGQWPVATLKKWGLLDEFYPTSVMETGYDILELWVSRMIMLGLYRTGKIPFKDVYLHGLVQGPDGQKMSKSKGNVVAPEKVIAEYGADTLRLFYIVGNKAGRAYRLTDDKLKGYRNFLNKVWNASRFIMMNLEDYQSKTLKEVESALTEEDKTMLAELATITEQVTKAMQTFRFGMVAVHLQQSFWGALCDTYLEKIKQRMYTKDREGNPINTLPAEVLSRKAAQYVLHTALLRYLQLLHPYIPFITDYLWQHCQSLYPNVQAESLMYTPWPQKQF